MLALTKHLILIIILLLILIVNRLGYKDIFFPIFRVLFNLEHNRLVVFIHKLDDFLRAIQVNLLFVLRKAIHSALIILILHRKCRHLMLTVLHPQLLNVLQQPVSFFELTHLEEAAVKKAEVPHQLQFSVLELHNFHGSFTRHHFISTYLSSSFKTVPEKHLLLTPGNIGELRTDHDLFLLFGSLCAHPGNTIG